MTNMERFFTELEGQLQAARKENRDRCQCFFKELKPRLEAARKLEHELNRHLAHRFNVFKYLRTNELGLSHIIADLLDSKASHGQGATFFRTLFEQLEERSGWPSGIKVDERSLSVCTEFNTAGNRRIDIAVQFKDTQGTPHCIAIENKPYADDQDNQIRAYLHFLNEKFEGRFILIYSPPSSQGPSSKSIDKFELDDRWTKHFRILPYIQAAADPKDGFEGYRLRDYSIEDWLADCRKNCDVERLRWFLRDAESFCQRKFGGHSMATNSDTRTIENFLYSNPEHLLTAQVVHDSWAAIKERVCSRFLNHLRDRIEQEAKEKLSMFSHDVRVGCKYGGEKLYEKRLWLYRSSWIPYQEAETSDSNQRTSIRLEAEDRGPNTWFYSVSSPLEVQGMSDSDRVRRSRLGAALNEEFMGYDSDSSERWAVWDYANEHMRDWNTLLPRLHRECEAKRGKITDYFVNRFLDVAARAIPIIDEFDRPKV